MNVYIYRYVHIGFLCICHEKLGLRDSQQDPKTDSCVGVAKWTPSSSRACRAVQGLPRGSDLGLFGLLFRNFK